MPRYIVRTNCEYSLAVDDADNADDAIRAASETDVKHWDQAWAPMEADEES
jgi:hypothetical protein